MTSTTDTTSVKVNKSQKRKNKLVWGLLLITIIISVSASLRHVYFHSTDGGSHESGFAKWGYPLAMIETGPFSVDTGSLTLKGSTYIKSLDDAHTNPKFLFSGIFVNGIAHGLFWVIIFEFLLWGNNKFSQLWQNQEGSN
jgi:hypothetical protein